MSAQEDRSFEEAVDVAPLEAAPPAAAGRPLAVWPVFAIYFAAIAASIAAQIPVAIAAVVVEVSSGGRPEDVLDFFGTPWGFIAFGVGPELALLGIWWLASRYGDPRVRRHRAIGTSSLSVFAYVCLLGATVAVLWMGEPLEQLGTRLFGRWQSDAAVQKLYENVTWPSGIALVLFISVAPAFAEELFFRGYMQRRLLDRWSPAVALPVVAVLFAMMHGTPVWALAVLPLGLWLGVLAWRTGSLWPAILCHGFINGSVNLWRVGAAMGAWPSDPAPAVTFGLGGTCLVCLLVAVWVLIKYPQHERRPG